MAEVKRITENRRARHDYHVIDTYEAGIALEGMEVKSLREGKANLQDSYAKVENGEITGRVKDTMVSGNVYQLLKELKEIEAIGSEAKWVGGSLQTPHLYFPKLSVASNG